MTQHPPAYYFLSAALLTSLGGGEWPWDQLLLGMRVISALLVSLSVPFVYGVARRFTHSPPSAVWGTLVVFVVLGTAKLAGTVTNDSLVILTAALATFFSVELMASKRRSWGHAFGASLALGLGLLTKGLMLTVVPVVGIALLVSGWRTSTRVLSKIAPALLGGILVICTGGWWWIRNYIVLGVVQPSSTSLSEDAVAEGTSLWGFITGIVVRFSGSFWAPTTLTTTELAWGTLMLALLAITVLIVNRRSPLILLLAVPPLTTIALNVAHSWRIYVANGTLAGSQGRYTFLGLVFFATVFTLIWTWMSDRLREHVRPRTNAVIIAATFAFSFYSLWSVIKKRWLADGGSVSDMFAMSALGPRAYVFLGVALPLLGIVLIVCATLLSNAPRRVESASKHSGWHASASASTHTTSRKKRALLLP